MGQSEEGQEGEDLLTYPFTILDWEFLKGRGQIQRVSSLNPYYLVQSEFSANISGINDRRVFEIDREHHYSSRGPVAY